MEERRLFYVACTRARQRLVVTAVASPDDEGEQPSRFLDELGVGIGESPVARVGRCPWRAWSPTLRAGRRPCRPPDTATRRGSRFAQLAIADPRSGTGRCRPPPTRSTWWGSPPRADRANRCGPRSPLPVSASLLQRWPPARRSGSSSAKPGESPAPISRPLRSNSCTPSPSELRRARSPPARTTSTC